jgi:uncharacterized protein
MSIQARTDAVSPYELARKHGLFSGEIAIAAFPRLGALVLGDGEVSVQLEFDRDDHGRARVRGNATLTPLLQCQRCLERIPRRLDVRIDMCVVKSDAQAAEVANERDVYVLTDDEVAIAELIEDDLLLALPSQVCDAYDACPNRPDLSFPAVGAVAANKEEPERANPFDVLAELKNRRN